LLQQLLLRGLFRQSRLTKLCTMTDEIVDAAAAAAAAGTSSRLSSWFGRLQQQHLTD
jgi:hypothetical protein